MPKRRSGPPQRFRPLHDQELTGGPLEQEVRLRTMCCGHVLWAHDAEHLQLLEDYVRSPLRERLRIRLGERALLARLPRWLIHARHRDEVLRALARLRRMLVAEA